MCIADITTVGREASINGWTDHIADRSEGGPITGWTGREDFRAARLEAES